MEASGNGRFRATTNRGRIMSIAKTTNYLILGDALDPNDLDIIGQMGRVPIGEPIPEGWRVLSGNALGSLVARIAYRYEIERTSCDD